MLAKCFYNSKLRV